MGKEKEEMRLTVKIGEYYCSQDKEKSLKPLYDKLGQLEDLMEKHNIKSIDDLDKKIKALDIIKEMLKQYGGLDFEEVETGTYIGTRTEPQYGRNYFIAKDKAKLLKEELL